MTDRELLEAAAMAAGHEFRFSPDWYCTGSPQIRTTSRHWLDWDPLTDDGDAFRLAASLGLVVDFSRPSAALPFTRHEYTLSEGGNNPEATRRAIVQAAAQIGGKHE